MANIFAQHRQCWRAHKPQRPDQKRGHRTVGVHKVISKTGLAEARGFGEKKCRSPRLRVLREK